MIDETLQTIKLLAKVLENKFITKKEQFEFYQKNNEQILMSNQILFFLFVICIFILIYLVDVLPLILFKLGFCLLIPIPFINIYIYLNVKNTKKEYELYRESIREEEMKARWENLFKKKRRFDEDMKQLELEKEEQNYKKELYSMAVYYFNVLGFDEIEIDDKVVKKTYRNLIKKCHPDVNPNAEKDAILINEAYEFIKKCKEIALF